MNPLLYGSLLVIALNAGNCNNAKEAQGEAAAATEAESMEKNDQRPDNFQENELSGQRWYILSIAGGELNLPEGAERPWIELSDGRLQGFGGCNNLMGSYSLENDRLIFSEVGSTKKYCQDVQATERSILDLLATVNSYKLQDDELQLLQGDSQPADKQTPVDLVTAETLQ